MNTQKPKIIVVGSFIVDIALYTPRFPIDGETVIGEQLKLGPGGKGSNQVTAAQRAGGNVLMISKVGNDYLNKILFDHYYKENMTTDYIYQSDEKETGTAVIEINNHSGENRIIVMKAANALLTREEVLCAEKEFQDAKLVLLQLESSTEAVIEAIRLAKKYHKPVILNPAPFQEIPQGLFDGIDYLTPNETEAEYFSGIPVKTVEDAGKAAEKLLETGVKNVIITLGKKGALLKNKRQVLLVKTTDLKPIDTTGAGDAFNGGLAVALSEGKNIVDAIQFANCTASISVTRNGSSPAMPYRHEIDALYQKYYGTEEKEMTGYENESACG